MNISHLIFNFALSLSLFTLYSQLYRFRRIPEKMRLLVGGVLFGAIAIAGMLYPYEYDEGLLFDGRSIVLSAAGFIGGWYPAGIAAVIASAWRLMQGGVGSWIGIVGIFGYALIGVGYRYLCQKYTRFAHPIYVYVFGVLVHLCMILGIFAWSPGTAAEILKKVALPVLIVYPAASWLSIVLMQGLEKSLLEEKYFQESDAQYRALFNDSFSVMLIVDPETAFIIEANEAASKFYGWTRAELKKKKITKINVMPANDIEAEIDKAHEGGRNFFVEKHQLANVEIREVEVFITPIQIESQKLLYYIVHDITERKRVEQALREFRQRYRMMLDNVEMIAVSLDSTGSITYCNSFLLNLTGWRYDEVIEQSWFELFVPPEIRQKLFESIIMKTFDEGEITSHNTNEIITRDGRRRTISWNNSLFRDLDGNIIGITSLGEDISERIQTEEALRKSDSFLANAQRMAQLGTWDWEIPNGKVNWSREVYDIYGVSSENFDPNIDSVMELFHPDDRQKHEEVLENIRKSQGYYEFEARIIWPDGSVRHVVSTSMGHENEKGDVVQISGTVQDITTRKKAEEELIQKQNNLEHFVNERTAELAERMRHVEQLNKGMVNLMQDLQIANQRTAAAARKLSIANTELENFAYSVSHDLRAPLRSISGFAQILTERHSQDLDDQGKQYIEYVVEASIQMGHLIDDLLQYSRLGRRAVQTRMIDTQLVFDEVLNDLQNQIQDSQAKVIITDELPTIEANHILLKQVFLNLIENALIYQGKNSTPEISISSQEDSEYAIISINDNGIGIEEDYYETIFNMFQRLHYDGEYSGTGIGLALVKKAVTLLNGEIWVDSARNVGSTFWVKMPLYQGEID